MLIHRFEDKFLSHFAYAIVHNGEMVLIDPSRNPQLYYDFAKQNHAKITAIIETHLHADFVSSHVEISKTTGAKIYMHPAAQPEFPYQSFSDDSPEISLGGFSLHALHTPGHSPDSICILLKDEKGEAITVFTGDTLFIGDVGRPDLRESTFTHDATREKLAHQLFHSLHDKLLKLDDDVLVFPAHGSGSLCGRNLSSQTSSTIGAEKISNTSLQYTYANAFVEMLLADQPMAPKYFPNSVALNRSNNVTPFIGAKQKVKYLPESEITGTTIIDTRPSELYKQGHIKNSLSIPNDKKFETWLGAIVSPAEAFVLLGENQTVLEELSERVIKIGYHKNLKGFVPAILKNIVQSNTLNVAEFEEHKERYLIVDVRNVPEVKGQEIFEGSINIPLHELRERMNEIPDDSVIIVHCAAGYRSGVAAAILEAGNFSAYDLGPSVKKFITAMPVH